MSLLVPNNSWRDLHIVFSRIFVNSWKIERYRTIIADFLGYSLKSNNTLENETNIISNYDKLYRKTANLSDNFLFMPNIGFCFPKKKWKVLMKIYHRKPLRSNNQMQNTLE